MTKGKYYCCFTKEWHDEKCIHTSCRLDNYKKVDHPKQQWVLS